MKKLMAIFVSVLCLGCLSLSAQGKSEAGKFSLAPGVGVSFPMGSDFSDGYNTALAFGVTAGYQVADIIHVCADLTYQSFPINKSDIPSSYTVSGGDFTVFSVIPNAKIYLPTNSKVEVYGMAGLGLFFSSISDLTITAPGYTSTTHWKNSETNLGIIFGAGVEIPMSKTINLLGEVRFTNVFPSSDDSGDSESLQYLSLRFGARFKI